MNGLTLGGRKDLWLWAATAPAVALVAVASTQPRLQAVALVCLLAPALLAWSGFRTGGLVVSFLICQSLVHLLKRAIFLFGPQPRAVYYGVQFFPTAVLLLGGAVALRRLRRWGLPPSGRALALFVALGTAMTALSVGQVPWAEGLMALHQQLLPSLMFFVGLTLTQEDLVRAARTMGILAAVSAVYGAAQLAGGPTPLDEAWAREAYSYSLHGSKVFAFLEGTTQDFRGYSYFADPLTWGFVLVAGLAGAFVAHQCGRISRAALVAISSAVLAGLVFGMTRTVWAGLGAAAAIYFLLRFRPLRRAWLVYGLLLGGFGATVLVGDTLYQRYFLERRLPAFQNVLASRYLTVGTIEARTGAWRALQEVVASSPILGRGYGVMFYASRNREAAQILRPPVSHNFLVETVYSVGVPGALVFLVFLWRWLGEGFAAVRAARDARLRRAGLALIAFVAGQTLTGYLNGPNFLTFEYFLFMGALAGLRHNAGPPAGKATPLASAGPPSGWSGLRLAGGVS